MKTITTLAAALLATFTAAPALAQDANVRSVAVSYADLDLGSEAGRATFDNRLRQAVREVCGVASSADLRGQNRVDECREDLTAHAAQQREIAIAGRQAAIVVAARR